MEEYNYLMYKDGTVLRADPEDIYHEFALLEHGKVILKIKCTLKMKKTLLLYILSINDQNTLAQIYVSFKDGIWPDALPKKYKPDWYDRGLPNSKEVFTELIQQHIASTVPAHIIEWWQDLRNKYKNPLLVKKGFHMRDLKTLK